MSQILASCDDRQLSKLWETSCKELPEARISSQINSSAG